MSIVLKAVEYQNAWNTMQANPKAADAYAELKTARATLKVAFDALFGHPQTPDIVVLALLVTPRHERSGGNYLKWIAAHVSSSASNTYPEFIKADEQKKFRIPMSYLQKIGSVVLAQKKWEDAIHNMPSQYDNYRTARQAFKKEVRSVCESGVAMGVTAEKLFQDFIKQIPKDHNLTITSLHKFIHWSHDFIKQILKDHKLTMSQQA